MLKLHTIWLLLAMVLMPSAALQAQELTLWDIYFSGRYTAYGSGQIQFQNTSSDYTQLYPDQLGNQELALFDIATGKKKRTIIQTGNFTEDLQFDSYEYSEDDRMILLGSETEGIYRHSTQAYFYIYDTEKAALEPLDPTRKQMYPLFSPDNRKVAYIVENDLYYKDLQTGAVRRITKDGEPGKIINGRPDWVYEEEFAIERLYEWSADGKSLLFARFDETDVPEFQFMQYGSLYPSIAVFKYPRAGEKNAKVTLNLYDTGTDTVQELEIPYEYEYIPRIVPADEGFGIMLLNRHQNHQQIIHFDPKTSESRLIYEYRHEKYIDEPSVFQYIGDGRYMIANDREGFQHIHIISQEEVRSVTSGTYEVTDFYGLDDDGWIYYQASVHGSEQRHIFKKNLISGEEVQLVKDAGIHDAVFSGDHRYFVNTWTAQGVPNVYTVRDNDGRLVRMIESNSEVRKRLKAFWQDKDFFRIDAGSYSIPAWMIKPPDFNPEKKYPVLNFVYGGPGRQRVRNEYLGLFDLWFQLLAQKGYIVVCSDNRGTIGNGSEYQKVHYMQLGTPEVEDQLLIIDHLKGLPYVDGDRIGYYGWSYGGYMALLMLFKGHGAVKAALSVAPVTDWKFYDTIYTERYMRTPTENPEGYKNGSPLESVGEWTDGKLFLAHGTADDNVHFQNTAELVKEMNRQGKHYDLYIYPDGAHGMGGYQNIYHLFEKMTDFILENL